MTLYIVFALISSCFFSETALATEFEVTVLKSELNRLDHFYINNNTQYALLYHLETIENLRLSVDVELEDYSEATCPLLLTVYRCDSVTTWSIPEDNNNKHDLHSIRHIQPICHKSSCQNSLLKIDLVTCSKKTLGFQIFVKSSKDFIIPLYKTQDITVTSLGPIFRKVDFYNPEADIITLKIYSECASCGLISIQPPRCPFWNDIKYIKHGLASWQSIQFKTAIKIQRSHYPNGVYIGFFVLPNDTSCTYFLPEERHRGNKQRNKTYTFSVSEKVVTSAYYFYEISLPLLTFTVFIGCIIIVQDAYYYYIRRYNAVNSILGKILVHEVKPKTVCIGDLASEEDIQKLFKSDNRYYSTFVAVVLWYLLPISKIVFHNMKVAYAPEGKELCYFNHFCSHPLRSLRLEDFNHIFSNIAYILYGLVYIFIVTKRERTERKNCETDEHATNGSLKPYGIFYAMGAALILQGISSGIYHICPSEDNFQLDTFFMRVISVIGIFAMYSLRHPVYLSANKTMKLLAILAALCMVGEISDTIQFRAIFTVIFIFFVIFFMTYEYYNGCFKDKNRNVITKVYKLYSAVYEKWSAVFTKIILRTEPSEFSYVYESNSTTKKLIVPIILVVCNISAVSYMWMSTQDFSFDSYVLFILVANSATYVILYVVMKMVHGEYKGICWLQPILYFITAFGLWMISGHYYANRLSSWDKSPSESRNSNDECILLKFYDLHDMWHFTSATAIFLLFMMLLTIDDDIADVPHSRIPVF